MARPITSPESRPWRARRARWHGALADGVALVAPQIASALLERKLLVGGRLTPIAVLQDLWIIGLFAIFLAALLFAARDRRLYRAALGAGLVLASLHCLLLGLNVTFVRVLGGPLTWQWLVLADFLRSTTPWLTIRASATWSGVALGIGLALLPPVCLAFVRKWAPANRIAASPLVIGAIVCILVVGAAGFNFHRPAKNLDFDARSNPALVMVRSYFADPDDLLEQFTPGGNIAPYRMQPAQPAPAGADKRPRPDIVLVVLESVGRGNLLRHLDAAPNIKRLMDTGEWFDEATVTVAESTRTNFSLMTSNTAVFAAIPETIAFADRRFTTFADVLHRGGYATHLFMSGDLGYQNVGHFLVNRGFDGLSDLNDIPCDEHAAKSPLFNDDGYVADRCTFDAARRWTANQRAPWFAMIWTGETHDPYALGTGAKPSSEEAYVEALRRSDRALGQFLARLPRRNGVPPTLIVMGDHGEAFGEHGFHWHSSTVFEEEIGIPLIIKTPALAAGTVRHDLAKPVDIGPTIVELAGLPRPAGWQGYSLLHPNPLPARFSFALNFAVSREPMVGLRTRDRKYIYMLDRKRMVEYDLLRDPHEQHPKEVNGTVKEAVGRWMAGWVQYNENR